MAADKAKAQLAHNNQTHFASIGPLKPKPGCPSIFFFASHFYMPEIKMGNFHLEFKNSSAADAAFNYRLWDQWESPKVTPAENHREKKGEKKELEFDVLWQVFFNIYY